MFPVNMKTSRFVYIYFSAQKDNLIPGIQSDTNMAVTLKTGILPSILQTPQTTVIPAGPFKSHNQPCAQAL